MKYRARYRCWECHHIWEGDPGPKQDADTLAERPTVCPKCGNNHFDWLNWKKIVRAVNKLRKKES